RQSLIEGAWDARNGTGFQRAIFGLIVAGDAALQEFSLCIEKPSGVEACSDGMLEKSLGSFLGVERGLESLGMKSGTRAKAEVVQELLRFVGGNFKGPREPAAQSAVQQRIADKEHKDDGQEGDGHRAKDHFCLEARAGLLLASFHQKANDGAGENEAKDQKSRSDEGGDSIECDDFAPGTRLHGHVQRTQSEDGGQKKGKQDAAESQAQPQSMIRGTHRAPSGVSGR